jgi:mono/diheme cytochrome c family protein
VSICTSRWFAEYVGRSLLLLIVPLSFGSLGSAQAETMTTESGPSDLFGQPIPPNGLWNLYQMEMEDLAWANRRGRLSLLDYPAQETTLGAPYTAINRLYYRLNRKPLLRLAMRRRGYSDVGRSWYDVYRTAGLVPYPRREGRGAYYVPFPKSGRPSSPMGFAVFRDRNRVPVFTVACAACHTRNLFGRPVMGATNLVGGASNSLMVLKHVANLRNIQYRIATRPTGGELAAFHNMQYQLSFVRGKRPQAKGLENPVAFVGMSLASRADDQIASRRWSAGGGRLAAELSKIPTDTKAPVLWNLKYKNRFQHDGSMTGNPMLANLIFNEIGRGADLKKLESWIDRNRNVIRDMTAAAYVMNPPRWTDFFSPETIDLAKARRGETVFNQRCAECHGTYEKAWSQAESESLDAAARLKTTRVVMPEENTIVRNVGTDANRSRAMVLLAERAGKLRIFRNNGITFQANPGAYVPPPLVGIWARWPYMHNNSIPNLDELLKPADQRVKAFYVGGADDANADYDRSAVGFPLGAKTPRDWRWRANLFDTRRPGLSNAGHDEGIFVKDGVSQLSPGEKADLIEYLKTL